MLGISPAHLALIVFVIILIFGTSKLKNLGKDLGGAIKGFKDSIGEDRSTQVAEKTHSADRQG